MVCVVPGVSTFPSPLGQTRGICTYLQNNSNIRKQDTEQKIAETKGVKFPSFVTAEEEIVIG